MSKPIRCTMVLSLALGSLASNAAADERHVVASAGGDVALYVPEEAPHEYSAGGYFGRLSWETAVPDYTTAKKGYRWALGIDPDIEFSRAWLRPDAPLTMLEAGLRMSVPFSQKRMGLLEVSARGGFWFAVRGGLTIQNDPGDRGDVAYQESKQGSSQEGLSQEPGGNYFMDFALGEFILLGNSGLRIEVEGSMLLAETLETFGNSEAGLRMRVGLGAYF